MQELYAYMRHNMHLNESTTRRMMRHLSLIVFNDNSLDFGYVIGMVDHAWDTEGGQYDPSSDQKSYEF